MNSTQQARRSNRPEAREVDARGRNGQNEETNETHNFFYKLAWKNCDRKLIIRLTKSGLLK